MLLLERDYEEDEVLAAAHPRAIYAVDIKGLDARELYRNTHRKIRCADEMMWRNIDVLERCSLPYYFTFTNVSDENELGFWRRFGELYPEQLA